MRVTASQLLTALDTAVLDTKLVFNGDLVDIVITVDEYEVGRLGCLPIERPRAKVSLDHSSVEVCPSPGRRGGFEVHCHSREEALLIAESLDECLETAFYDLLEPAR